MVDPQVNLGIQDTGIHSGWAGNLLQGSSFTPRGNLEKAVHLRMFLEGERKSENPQAHGEHVKLHSVIHTVYVTAPPATPRCCPELPLDLSVLYNLSINKVLVGRSFEADLSFALLHGLDPDLFDIPCAQISAYFYTALLNEGQCVYMLCEHV